MKTLLSLTSRTFGKDRVRVFFKDPDGMVNREPGITSIPESSRRTQILVATAALIAGLLGTPKAQAEGNDVPVVQESNSQVVAISTVPPKVDASILIVPSKPEPKVESPKVESSEKKYTLEALEFLARFPKNVQATLRGDEAIDIFLEKIPETDRVETKTALLVGINEFSRLNTPTQPTETTTPPISVAKVPESNPATTPAEWIEEFKVATKETRKGWSPEKLETWRNWKTEEGRILDAANQKGTTEVAAIDAANQEIERKKTEGLAANRNLAYQIAQVQKAIATLASNR